ncbi:MAG: hypothetical protein ACJ8AH_06310 [Stellaceae bacterium]
MENGSQLPDRRGSAKPPARSVRESNSQGFSKINEMVCELASKELSEEVQEQLARIRSFLDSEHWSKDFIPPLITAVTALAAPKPNVLLAQGIMWDLEFYLNWYNPGYGPGKLLMKISGGWPMAVVVTGLVAAGATFGMILVVLLALGYFDRLPALIVNNSEVLIVMFFGVLGGAMSILTRIKRPSDLQKLNPISVFLNCFFKPLVGGIFAVIIYAMFKSDLIGSLLKANVSGDNVFFLLAVIGFVSGFSERVAVDAIGGLEGTFTRKG